MNRSQRIYFDTGNTGNKYINIKLEQGVDTLEFMSMSLSTKDAYQDFNADYGVLVGKVTANGGVGVENAKVSIFIPLLDEDMTNGEIKAYYPYKTPRDKNVNGKRYNLLPRVSRINPNTGQIEPKQAFGSFPIKEEIIANETTLEVYKKYYKYVTTTNSAGDYMIFGVPIGTQTVHMSVDITDIGRYSMNPAAMVNLGYSTNLFTDNRTRIKSSSDLNDLPHIETQDITVDVIPFWGDTENFEIGITRQDFRIRAELVNQFVLFGTAFTDSAETMRGTEDPDDPNEKEIRDFYRGFPNSRDDDNDRDYHAVSLATKRIGTITEKIYYYPADISDYKIDNNQVDPESDMKILDKSEYSVYTRNGDYVFLINCNRRKIITDDFGNEIVVDDDSTEGVFTEFRGFVILEYTPENLPMVSQSSLEGDQTKAMTLPLRLRFKFPQHADEAQSFDYNNDNTATAWRKQHMKFEARKFYSFSKFHGCVANNQKNDTDNENKGQFPLTDQLFFSNETTTPDNNGNIHLNNAARDGRFNIGPIITYDFDTFNNSQYELEPNCKRIGSGGSAGDPPRFGANWLNLCVYFPQTGYAVRTLGSVKNVRTSDFLATQWENGTQRNKAFVVDNNMPIAAGDFNTKWMGRSDLHWTDIVEVPISDIQVFRNQSTKGFRLLSSGFNGKYRNGTYTPDEDKTYGFTWSAPCPLEGGKIDGNPENNADSYYYFYRGFGEADCIDYLYELGLVNG